MKFKLKNFNELSVDELYRLLRLRQEVFVLEQACFYQDLDGKDRIAQQLWLEDDKGEILASCRLFKRGDFFWDAASIGRVITSKKVRKKGLGRMLLQEALLILNAQNEKKITIEAQCYAKSFYEKIGFHPISDVFLEDGIEHLLMSLEF